MFTCSPKLSWKIVWNLNQITTSTIDTLKEQMIQLGGVKKTKEMKSLLANTKHYIETYSRSEDIWKNVRIVIHDPQGNELILIAGDGSFRLLVGQISGKNNIVCIKDGVIVIQREFM